MQNGALYQQQTLAHRTGESESGLSLPTPTATNARQGINSKNNQGQPLLPMAAMTWLTPTSAMSKQGCNHPDGKRGATLIDLVKNPARWPTPTRRNPPDCPAERKRHTPGLESAVRMFQTPTANEDAAGRPGAKMQKMLGNSPDIRNDAKGDLLPGTLNPTWVEWLMGWPPEWTDLKPSATDKYLNAQPKHGDY